MLTVLYNFIVHSPIFTALFSHFQEELGHKGNAMLLYKRIIVRRTA